MNGCISRVQGKILLVVHTLNKTNHHRHLKQVLMSSVISKHRWSLSLKGDVKVDVPCDDTRQPDQCEIQTGNIEVI